MTLRILFAYIQCSIYLYIFTSIYTVHLFHLSIILCLQSSSPSHSHRTRSNKNNIDPSVNVSSAQTYIIVRNVSHKCHENTVVNPSPDYNNGVRDRRYL